MTLGGDVGITSGAARVLDPNRARCEAAEQKSAADALRRHRQGGRSATLQRRRQSRALSRRRHQANHRTGLSPTVSHILTTENTIYDRFYSSVQKVNAPSLAFPDYEDAVAQELKLPIMLAISR